MIHEIRDGVFRPVGVPEADFTFQPATAVVNRPVDFNASVSGNTTAVETYMWDFGDGEKMNVTVPEVSHNYTSTGDYVASLVVLTLDEMQSAATEKTVRVVQMRDLAVSQISELYWSIYKNLTWAFRSTVNNVGNASEQCTAIAYFNTSNVDLGNPAAAAWIEIERKTTSISPGGSRVLDFTFNASKTPIAPAYYYILVNATGIPFGYEETLANNIKLSTTAILVTDEIIHSPTIESLERGYEVARRIFHPMIAGEPLMIRITVMNNGTYLDVINVTLYINDAVEDNWLTAALQPGGSASLESTSNPVAGSYNLTIEARVGSNTAVLEGNLLIVIPPDIAVDHSPAQPSVNQTLTLDASASQHGDPNGNLTLYSWNIYAPRPDGTAIVDPDLATIFAHFAGPESTMSFTPTTAGNWTFTLTVTDNFGITFDTRRANSNPYKALFYVQVGGAGPAQGFTLPIEYIAAIIVVAAFVVALAFLLYRRSHKGVPAEPTAET
jgi:PKD repeat protein